MRILSLACALSLFTVMYAQNNHLDEIKEAVAGGNAKAMYHLATHYMDGDGVEMNFSEAIKLIRKSSEKGNDDAIRFLANVRIYDGKSFGDDGLIPWYYYIRLDDNEFTKYFKLATGGAPDACLLIGHYYYHKRDYLKAIEFYEKVLNNVSGKNVTLSYDDEKFEAVKVAMDAYTMIAYCYEVGNGVPINYKKSLGYYMLGGDYISISAENFEKYEAQIKDVYIKGFNKAREDWLVGSEIYDAFTGEPEGMIPMRKEGVLAVKAGMYWLADIWYNEMEEAIIKKENHRYDAIDVFWIAERYYSGLGKPIDYNKAYKYYIHFTNDCQGPRGSEITEYNSTMYADACFRLYQMYKNGKGCRANQVLADKYFRTAIKYGSMSALKEDQLEYDKINKK